MRSFPLPLTIFLAFIGIGFGATPPLVGQERQGDRPPPPQAPQPKDGPTTTSTKDLAYTTPKEWRAVEAGPLLTAKLQVGKDDPSGTVTIMALAAPGGGLGPNINRWRAQVGLEPLEDEEATVEAAKETKIDGVLGHVVDLTGPVKEGKPAQRILVALVRQGDQVWFFKLVGSAALVDKEKARFEAFLNSVRFRRP